MLDTAAEDLSMMSRHASALLSVDLDALRHNYRLLRSLAGSAACASVLKANAYGLGAEHIAPVLAEEGCRHFFVAHVDEGIALRSYVPADAAVYVLHGIPDVKATNFVRHDLTPVLNSIEQVSRLARVAGVASPASNLETITR